jgi:hypothetical protein
MVNEVAAICKGLSPPVKLTVTPKIFLDGMDGSSHKASMLQDLLAKRPFETSLSFVHGVTRISHFQPIWIHVDSPGLIYVSVYDGTF